MFAGVEVHQALAMALKEVHPATRRAYVQ